MFARVASKRTKDRARRARVRRGITGVLAMMFLIMFASLATLMAVVSKGNLRTADTHRRVGRAQGATDSALEIGAQRLKEATSRFLVSRGEISPTYAQQLWDGSFAVTPPVTILPPRDGTPEAVLPGGIREALEFRFAADDAANIETGVSLPTPPTGWIIAAPIGLDRDADGNIVTAAQIAYLPPDANGDVLIVATGYEWDWVQQRWLTRTAQQRFGLSKRIEHAILAPSRIMLGRNVQVDGPLGARYNSQALDTLDGPPLVVKSDFIGLTAMLDSKLADFYTAVQADDVDGDNRLREQHATESSSLAALNAEDYDGDTLGDLAFEDETSDGAVDEFDVFLKHYDTNGDGKLILSDALTQGTVHAGMTPEFDADDALALLIDTGNADRNRNGMSNGRFTAGAWDYASFRDNNMDGSLDSSDVDPDDVTLGYRDGAIDRRDMYAKIRGSVTFRANRADWEASTGFDGSTVLDYQRDVRGAIRPSNGDRPISFDATDEELPAISADSFNDATLAMIALADGSSFDSQVAAQGGVTESSIESTPFGSPTPADYYDRPIFRDMTFKNTVIPMGTNGLFINCTFVGVTRVEAYQDNTHPSWIFYGHERLDAQAGTLSLSYPPPPEDSDAQLDKSYAEPAQPGYDTLPDPLVVSVDIDGDGSANDPITDTKLITNNIRFHDCLFVGAIVADKPAVFHAVRAKLQFTGATRFTDTHPTLPHDPAYNPDSADMDSIARSSMMLPNYSVDIGTNNSPPAQDVQLRGAIIAGVLDIRGNAEIVGAILTTFEPVYGSEPLSIYGDPVGNPANFNITLGYFGPEDGDGEGIDLSAMTDLDGDGALDIGWDSARDSSGNLIPTAGFSGTHNDDWYDGVADTYADIDPGNFVRRAIMFEGYGKVQLRYDPDLILPDGLATPLSSTRVPRSYTEGRFNFN